MAWLASLRAGMRALLRRERVDRELDEELAEYLEASMAEKRRRGMNAREARRAAKVEMGPVVAVKHRVWASRWESAVEHLAQDVRLGIRGLAKSPGFTLVALLSLALGIGANTAIFTLINAILLRPLPVEKPQELVLFGDGRATGSTGGLPDGDTRLYSYPFYRSFSAKTVSYAGVAAVHSAQAETQGAVSGQAAEKLHIDLVSGSYFSVLGVRQSLGRLIGPADDTAAGGSPIVVASYAWFQRHFNGDPAALGQVVRTEGHDYTLVGVAQPGFEGFTLGQPTDLWVPLAMEKEIYPGWNGLDDKLFQSLIVFARLKPGVTAAQAGLETNQLFKQILRSDFVGPQPSQKELEAISHARIDLTPAGHGLSRLRHQFSLPLQILMGIVGLVLLIACANIANMLLARGVARAREVAVRMALGASRGRIVVQLLTESGLLALTGAALGIALAWRASAVLLRMATPGPTPVPLNLQPDLWVLGFTLLLTVVTALLFGTAPALKATRLELTPTLKEGRGGGVALARSRLGQGLIVGQIALSILLLVAAGLFLRSLRQLTSVDTGFDKKNVLMFAMDATGANLPQETPEEFRSVQLQEQIEQRVRALPGVQSDSFSMFTFNQGEWSNDAVFQGVARTPENSRDVLFNNVGSGFFQAMGLTLKEGRGFTPQDTQHSVPVAVINETMARRFFPDRPVGETIGHSFTLDEGHDSKNPAIQVVGVVKDAKYVRLGEEQEMAAYFPCTQRPGFYGNFLVRYAGDPSPVIAGVRQAVKQVNPDILIDTVSSLEDQVDGSMARQSLIAKLSAFFGLLAVFLACIGIYGLIDRKSVV